MTKKIVKCEDQLITDRYAIYQGDCVEVMAAMPDASVDFTIYSPPFVGLYRFSSSPRDVSNSDGPAFWLHYKFIINEVLRVTKPGRLCSVHVMNLSTTKSAHGKIGIYDFRGDVIRAHVEAGWIHHSEVCIPKDPVQAQHRTKSIRLLHKQLVKDSAMSGQTLADYIVTFRKPGVNEDPIAGCFKRWIGEGDGPDMAKYTTDDDRRNWYSIEVWQRYAAVVWADIRQSRTLNYRAARDGKDEAHISPLQMDVIERCIELWSNPNDVVFTPFMGIGSEVFGAVDSGRRGIGIELKPSYYVQAVRNLELAGRDHGSLFDDVDESDDEYTLEE